MFPNHIYNINVSIVLSYINNIKLNKNIILSLIYNTNKNKILSHIYNKNIYS